MLEGDTAEEVAQEFGATHGLDSNATLKIKALIDMQLAQLER